MAYWNVLVYSDSDEERETILGISESEISSLMRVLDREGVRAKAIMYPHNGPDEIDSYTINWE